MGKPAGIARGWTSANIPKRVTGEKQPDGIWRQPGADETHGLCKLTRWLHLAPPLPFSMAVGASLHLSEPQLPLKMRVMPSYHSHGTLCVEWYPDTITVTVVFLPPLSTFPGSS